MVDFSPYVEELFGVDIQIHWISILFILLIILTGNIELIIIFVNCLFCVLLHELGHSVVARANKVDVKKILIVLPIGGGSIIDNDKLTSTQEYKITVSGPLVSIAIAAAFFVIYAIPGWGSGVSYVLYSLFLINLVLGVLNLLPWFPLDGGRILRSYLRKTKSFFESTKISVDVSKIITVLFVIASLIYFYFAKYPLETQVLVDIFTVFIAFFIYSGATQEMKMAYAKEYTTSLKAKDAMAKNFVLVKSTTTLENIYKIISRKRTNLVIFKEGDKIKAFYLTAKSPDAIAKMIERGVTVSSLGITIPKMKYNDKLYRALDIMSFEERNIVAVEKGNRIVGIVTEAHAEMIIAVNVSKRKMKEKDISR